MFHEYPELAPIIAGRHYLIATDGACIRNPGPGGWGFIKQLKDGAQLTRQGQRAGQSPVVFGETSPTNNRMELMAAIRAVEGIADHGTPAIIMSDSEYVVFGMSDRLPGWKERGWRTADKKPVKNRDLWERLEVACDGKSIHWFWVKGHAGHELNEIANTLADNAARGKYPTGWKKVKAIHPEWLIG